MRYRGHRIELIEPGTKQGQFRRCQVAVDGTPCVPFDVHEADFLSFRSDRERTEFLARQAMGLIDTYGDARHPKGIIAAPSVAGAE